MPDAQEDIEMDGDEGQQDEPAQPQGRPPVPHAPTVVISGPAAADLIAKSMVTVKAFPGTPAAGTPTAGTAGRVDSDQKPITPSVPMSAPAAVAKAGEVAASSAPVVVAPQAAAQSPSSAATFRSYRC